MGVIAHVRAGVASRLLRDQCCRCPQTHHGPSCEEGPAKSHTTKTGGWVNPEGLSQAREPGRGHLKCADPPARRVSPNMPASVPGHV